jgi:hypothetical protein
VLILVILLSKMVYDFIFRSLTKSCPEFIRTSMLTFFNNTADDLGHTIQNLQEVSFFSIEGTITAEVLSSLRDRIGEIQPF